MPDYYLDSSALIKRYRSERGSGFVGALFEPGRERLITSFFSLLESRAVIARMRKAREISESSRRLWRDRLLGDAAMMFTVIALTDELMADATHLIDVLALKAPDAIQLSSAMSSRSIAPGLVFLSADRQLLAAARAESFSVINPDDV